MKKNILMIMPDQLRADYLGCYGAEFAHTPNIDKLSKEGVQYASAISPSPLCVPARASMLTGQNAVRNGVLENSSWLRPDHEACGVKTWPKQLSEAGYHTVGIGKMHFYPWDIMEGFDHRVIAEDKRHVALKDDYADYLEAKGLRKYAGIEYPEYIENKGAMTSPFSPENEADHWITDCAVDYILQDQGEKPFAMMVGLVSPHCPYDPLPESLEAIQDKVMPDLIEETKDSQEFLEIFYDSYRGDWCGLEYKDATQEHWKKIQKHYSALIHQVDECVGKIVQALKDKGIYEDTIIIFTSDHGDMVGDYHLLGKHYFYESSIHIPMILRHPDYIKDDDKAEVREEVVCLTDIYATMLHLAGMEDCETKDSRILTCLNSKNHASQERFIFGGTDLGFMIRTGKWKYCKYQTGSCHLYDLERDMHEQNNLVDDLQYRELIKKLDGELMKQLMDSILDGNRDKKVDFTDHDGIAFHDRGWNRIYPNTTA